jgi:hypothetical protein
MARSQDVEANDGQIRFTRNVQWRKPSDRTHGCLHYFLANIGDFVRNSAFWSGNSCTIAYFFTKNRLTNW